MSRLNADHYAGSETITIRVPLNMPYSSNSDSYERTNGEFEYNGEFYRLVKQKRYNDTLYVVCIKDIDHQRLKETLNQYANSLTDKTPVQKSSSPKSNFDFLKEYIVSLFDDAGLINGWSRNLTYAHENNLYRYQFIFSTDHPPEFFS